MAKPKTKEQITVTIDADMRDKLKALAVEEKETFSDVINDCLKLGEPEYVLYTGFKKGYLQKVLAEKEKKLKEEGLIKD